MSENERCCENGSVGQGVDSYTYAATHLKARHPISYADAFAAALAQLESATLVTGDREFEAVQGVIRIEWLEKR